MALASFAPDSSTREKIAYPTIGAGVITGLLAAPFGTMDWLGIPRKTRATRTGGIHGLGNVVVGLLFA